MSCAKRNAKSELRPVVADGDVMNDEDFFRRALANLKEATEAGYLVWKREPRCDFGNVWYSAELTFATTDPEATRCTICFRFHYYSPSKSLRREVIPGRTEVHFWMESNNFGINTMCGTREYYHFIVFIASLFEEHRRRLENDVRATERICRVLDAGLFKPEADLYDNDMGLIRFLLMETRRGRIVWRKKGMADRSRFLSTTIHDDTGRKSELRVKALRSYMTDSDRWRRIDTPLFMVLEIPGRKIPFFMGSEPYVLLEEIVAAAKRRVLPCDIVQNALRALQKYGGKDLSGPVDGTDGCTYYEAVDALLARLLELTRAGIVHWKEIGSCQYVGFLPDAVPGKRPVLKIERHWLCSTNQPGNDPLAMEAKLFGKSYFGFIGVGHGRHLSDLFGWIWEQKDEYYTHDDSSSFEERVEMMRKKLFPDV